MKQQDFKEKLVKLLNLTTSDNDHEALLSMRMVNKLLVKNSLTWEGLLSHREPGFQFHQRRSYVDLEAEELIAFIRENAWQNFDFRFVDDLEKGLKQYGRLTQKQKAALQRIATAIRNRR